MDNVFFTGDRQPVSPCIPHLTAGFELHSVNGPTIPDDQPSFSRFRSLPVSGDAAVRAHRHYCHLPNHTYALAGLASYFTFPYIQTLHSKSVLT